MEPTARETPGTAPAAAPDPTASRPMGRFLLLTGGQALSLLGTEAVQFALIWWLTVETGSAAVLATATLFGLLPRVVAGPFIGTLVDRWNRKTIMLLADGAAALASLVLAVLFASGSTRVEFVFGLLLVRSICSAFHGAAMLASTTLMVPHRHLTRVQGLNQMIQGGLLIVAAPLGAVLLGLMSMGAIMLVDVGTAIFAILPLIFIDVPQPDRPAGAGSRRSSVWRETWGGVQYLRERSGHIALLVLSVMVNLFLVPAFSLLPLLVTEWNGGPMLLGWMNSALGVGTIAGGIALGIWGGFRRKIHTTLAGLFVVGVATLALGFIPGGGVTLPIVTLLLVGLAIPITNGPIQALLQATVAPEVQGRIFTLYGSLCGAAAPLGLILAAPVAELAGVRIWYWTGGAVCMLLAVGALFVPALLTIEQRPAQAPEAADTERPAPPD